MGTSVNVLTDAVIGSAIEVHRHLGPGLLESAYRECLLHELKLRRLDVVKERQLPVVYKGIVLDCVYRIDLVVENRLIVELKTVEKILPVHKAQLLTYLRWSGISTGLLLNFSAAVLKDGIERLVL